MAAQLPKVIRHQGEQSDVLQLVTKVALIHGLFASIMLYIGLDVFRSQHMSLLGSRVCAVVPAPSVSTGASHAFSRPAARRSAASLYVQLAARLKLSIRSPCRQSIYVMPL